MQSYSSINRRARLIARACGLASGALAVFWFTQILRGTVPPDDIYVVCCVFYFAIIGVSLFLFDKVQGDGRFLAASWLPFLPLAARLALESKYRFNVVGMLGLVAVAVFLVVFYVLQRQRVRAAQQGVASDGAAPRR